MLYFLEIRRYGEDDPTRSWARYHQTAVPLKAAEEMKKRFDKLYPTTIETKITQEIDCDRVWGFD